MCGYVCQNLFFVCQLFLEAAKECCKNHNVQPTDVFIQKMIQTYEMMIVRHGYVMCFSFHAGVLYYDFLLDIHMIGKWLGGNYLKFNMDL